MTSTARRELIRLVRRIQALTVEIEELQHGEGGSRKLHAKERKREQLLWRLAVVARRTASGDRAAA